jgi:predicted phosphodiesterase
VAILSVIHGNRVGLEAVISDLKRRKAERVLYLGDIAPVGPQPRQVIELLRILRWPCVMGNTDATLAKNIAENFGDMYAER